MTNYKTENENVYSEIWTLDSAEVSLWIVQLNSVHSKQ